MHVAMARRRVAQGAVDQALAEFAHIGGQAVEFGIVEFVFTRPQQGGVIGLPAEAP